MACIRNPASTLLKRAERMHDVPPHITSVLSALKFSESRRESLRALTDSEWENILSRWQNPAVDDPFETCLR